MNLNALSLASFENDLNTEYKTGEKIDNIEDQETTLNGNNQAVEQSERMPTNLRLDREGKNIKINHNNNIAPERLDRIQENIRNSNLGHLFEPELDELSSSFELTPGP